MFKTRFFFIEYDSLDNFSNKKLKLVQLHKLIIQANHHKKTQ